VHDVLTRNPVHDVLERESYSLGLMKITTIRTIIPDDHRLLLDVPEDVPAGPAEVVVRPIQAAASLAELELSADQQSHLLREWAAHGPQGPLDADEAWPDES